MQQKLLTMATAAVLASGCDIFSRGEAGLDREVREKFAHELKALPPVDFMAIMGRTPSPAELELGRQLFNDPILSRNNDVSCATCHLSNHGFADGVSLSVGSGGQGGPDGGRVGKSLGEGDLSTTRGLGDDGFGFITLGRMFRNTLSPVNVAYRMDAMTNDGLLHDGRFGDLPFQVLLPIHTPEELCGANPIPHPGHHENPFREGGALFREPVVITHSHSYDPATGRDTGFFNTRTELVRGVPDRRPDGSISRPTRNECLAIAIAKIRSVPQYRKQFKAAYGADEVSDVLVGRALATFLMTIVSRDTPYDRFVSGENALSATELIGMAMFFTPPGQEFELGGKKHVGAGCAGCHAAPTFGGKGFASLGVRSDPRSSLSRPSGAVEQDNGFFSRPRVQRGTVPSCHVQNVTVNSRSNYAPDIGRANATYDSQDCFQFRIPPLRNVVETYPYFHHGTERAFGSKEQDLKKRAYEALRNVVLYHLRGPVSIEVYDSADALRRYFDDFYQTDVLVPFYAQNFNGFHPKNNAVFPIKMSDDDVNALTDFIAYGLWDKRSMKRGSLGNDVSHPGEVLSGFTPVITRDHGTQLEMPPEARLQPPLVSATQKANLPSARF